MMFLSPLLFVFLRVIFDFFVCLLSPFSEEFIVTGIYLFSQGGHQNLDPSCDCKNLQFGVAGDCERI